MRTVRRDTPGASPSRIEYAKARRELHAAHRALEANDTPQHRDAADKAEQILERARAAVMDEDPNLMLVRELSMQSYEDLQAQVGDKAVAAMWLLSEQWAGVFIISQDLSEPRTLEYSESDVARLKQSVSELQTATANGDAGALNETLEQLSAALRMDEVHRLLREGDRTYRAPNYSQLVLLPHGVLNAVPIDCLQCGSHGSLADTYNGACVYAPSLRMYGYARARSRPETASPVQLVVIQNPTDDLTGADEEAREILKLAENQQALSSISLAHAEATKSEVLEAIQRASSKPFAVHVAAHGAHRDRWTTALQLAEQTELTVADAIALSVPNLRLCVLSACETALNDSVSDAAAENIGMPTAFLVAGATCVVAGLWRVSDAATALLQVEMWIVRLTLSPQ